MADWLDDFASILSSASSVTNQITGATATKGQTPAPVAPVALAPTIVPLAETSKTMQVQDNQAVRQSGSSIGLLVVAAVVVFALLEWS